MLFTIFRDEDNSKGKEKVILNEKNSTLGGVLFLPLIEKSN